MNILVHLCIVLMRLFTTGMDDDERKVSRIGCKPSFRAFYQSLTFSEVRSSDLLGRHL